MSQAATSILARGGPLRLARVNEVCRRLTFTCGLPRNPAGIKPSDLEATIKELYDTHAEWHGNLKPARRRQLLRQLEVVAGGGVEPPTQGFSVLCSTN